MQIATGPLVLATAGVLVVYAGITGQSPATVFRTVASGRKPAAASSTSSIPASTTSTPTAQKGAISTTEMDTQQLESTWGAPGSNQVTVNFQGHLLEFHSGGPAAALKAVSDQITAAATGYAFTNCSTLAIRGRTSDASQMSYHAFGLAIDINPQTNPYVASGASAQHDIPNAVVQIFKNNAFVWGGDWDTPKDYMHFEYHGSA